MDCHPGFSPVRLEGIKCIPYRLEYSCVKTVVFASAVVTFENTFSFHVACEAATSDSRGVSEGSSASKSLQALADEMNETPTLDEREVTLNVNTPPSRSVPLTDVCSPYWESVVPVPEKVLLLVAVVLNLPQK